MSAVIFEYIKVRRHGKVAKVGVIMAAQVKDTVRVGFSKCNTDLDKFDTKIACDIAKDRIEGMSKSPKTPDCIKRQVRQFGARAIRYFQDARIVELPE